MKFRDRLRTAMEAKESLLCVGLDPQPDRTPPEEILAFNTRVVEATSEYVCAYKPQSAFYEVAGDTGWVALRQTIKMIREKAPHAIVLLDAKRGDVANTAQACADALFEWFKADAATVNPYMGRDSVEPFLEYSKRGKGAFFLCRTSNKGSSEFQELTVKRENGEESPLYLEVARGVESWGRDFDNSAGLVVGATWPEELARVREACPNIPILLPGVGTQGGALRESVANGVDESGDGLLVSSSRSIIYAEDVEGAARDLREAINLARKSHLGSSDAEPTLAAAGH